MTNLKTEFSNLFPDKCRLLNLSCLEGLGISKDVICVKFEWNGARFFIPSCSIAITKERIKWNVGHYLSLQTLIHHRAITYCTMEDKNGSWSWWLRSQSHNNHQRSSCCCILSFSIFAVRAEQFPSRISSNKKAQRRVFKFWPQSSIDSRRMFSSKQTITLTKNW